MRKPLLVASVVVHAGAFTALALAAMWRVDKLPLEDRGGVVASFMLPQDTGGGAAPKPEKLEPMKKRKIVPKETVQPQQLDKEEQDASAASTSEVIGTSTEGPPGNGTGGDGLGEKAPTGDCATPPCDGTQKEEPIVEKKKEEKKVEKKKPITIPESKLKRISGNARIEAPNNVKVSMQRAGDSKVVGTIKVCGDKGGRVVRTSVAKSTGYEAYDDKLASEMSDWRYEPLLDEDGEPTSFCTFVTLIYVMQ
jgi:hypothetical protein